MLNSKKAVTWVISILVVLLVGLVVGIGTYFGTQGLPGTSINKDTNSTETVVDDGVVDLGDFMKTEKNMQYTQDANFKNVYAKDAFKEYISNYSNDLKTNLKVNVVENGNVVKSATMKLYGQSEVGPMISSYALLEALELNDTYKTASFETDSHSVFAKSNSEDIFMAVNLPFSTYKETVEAQGTSVVVPYNNLVIHVLTPDAFSGPGVDEIPNFILLDESTIEINLNVCK